MEIVPVQRWMDPKTSPPYPASRQFYDIVRSFLNFGRLQEEADFFERHILQYQTLLCNSISTRRLLEEAPLYKSKWENIFNNFWFHFFSKQRGNPLSPERCLKDYNSSMKSEIKKNNRKLHEKKNKQRGKKKKGKKKR